MLITPCHLTSRGRTLDTSSERFGYLSNSAALLGDTTALQNRFEQDGYLYFKRFFDPELIREARRSVFQKLAAAGYFNPAHDLMEGVLKGDVTDEALAVFVESMKKAPAAPVQRVVFGDEICNFFSSFFGEPIRYLDYIWTRVKCRGFGAACHCDWVYMGRGSQQLMTSWIPYVDVPLEMGGVMILERSHHQRERFSNYLSRDVDTYCSNKPAEKQAVEVEGKSAVSGWLSTRPDTLAEKFDTRWLTAENWECGDLLTFRMDLIHGSLDNQTDCLRFSTDTRYQPASHPADERWVGVNPPGHSRSTKRGRIC